MERRVDRRADHIDPQPVEVLGRLVAKTQQLIAVARSMCGERRLLVLASGDAVRPVIQHTIVISVRQLDVDAVAPEPEPTAVVDRLLRDPGLSRRDSAPSASLSGRRDH